MNNMSDVIQSPTSTSNEPAVSTTAGVSRRSFVGSAALAGMALAAGPGTSSAADVQRESQVDEALNVKIRRARLSGPSSITKDATDLAPVKRIP
jgi:hypothetical protein